MADTCPRCGFAEVVSDKSPKCGVVIAVYQASLDKRRRGPQAGGSPLARSSPPAGTTPTASAAPRPLPEAPTPAAARPAPATTGTRHAIFRGSGSSLFGIHVINALLILATLGVYFFWAKVRVRNYLWSESEFEGDRFAYHGTGRELIIGFAKAFAFFLLPMTLLNTLPEIFEASALVIMATRLPEPILAGILIAVALVGASRFRL